jgi:hypothetical protein
VLLIKIKTEMVTQHHGKAALYSCHNLGDNLSNCLSWASNARLFHSSAVVGRTNNRNASLYYRQQSGLIIIALFIHPENIEQ